MFGLSLISSFLLIPAALCGLFCLWLLLKLFSKLSVLRLLVEQQRHLDLKELLRLAYQQYPSLPQGEAVVEQVLHYMLERFRAWYEEQSIPVEVFQAVSAKQLSQPLDIDQRVQAVNHFRQLSVFLTGVLG